MQWGKIRQEQLSHAILITKDTVLGYLKKQLQKGNWKDVLDVLEGKPMTVNGKLLQEELRNRIASNLILQLHIRHALAISMAVIILPLILSKLSGLVLGKIKGFTEE